MPENGVSNSDLPSPTHRPQHAVSSRCFLCAKLLFSGGREGGPSCDKRDCVFCSQPSRLIGGQEEHLFLWPYLCALPVSLSPAWTVCLFPQLPRTCSGHCASQLFFFPSGPVLLLKKINYTWKAGGVFFWGGGNPRLNGAQEGIGIIASTENSLSLSSWAPSRTQRGPVCVRSRHSVFCPRSVWMYGPLLPLKQELSRCLQYRSMWGAVGRNLSALLRIPGSVLGRARAPRSSR